jgi:hypothetical protein
MLFRELKTLLAFAAHSDGELWCAVKALVHSGGIPARELVRSTR